MYPYCYPWALCSSPTSQGLWKWEMCLAFIRGNPAQASVVAAARSVQKETLVMSQRCEAQGCLFTCRFSSISTLNDVDLNFIRKGKQLLFFRQSEKVTSYSKSSSVHRAFRRTTDFPLGSVGICRSQRCTSSSGCRGQAGAMTAGVTLTGQAPARVECAPEQGWAGGSRSCSPQIGTGPPDRFLGLWSGWLRSTKQSYLCYELCRCLPLEWESEIGTL